MGTYYIPRNVKGESRILMIFTVKSLITTAIGLIIGVLFYFIFRMVNLGFIGIIIAAVFALIGFGIGTIKIPALPGIPFTKNISGEPLSEIIIRYVKFKKNKKIYKYTEEEEENR